LVRGITSRQRGAVLTGKTFRELTFAFVSDRNGQSARSSRLKLEWDMFIPNAGQSTETALHVRYVAKQLLLRVDYNVDLVQPAWATSMTATLEGLIHSVAEDPEQSLRAPTV
jgi:hypothetical protein